MKKIVFCIVLFSTVSLSRAQGVLTLPDAVNIALKNSLDIQLGKNTIEANTILNNYGVAGGLPLVTGDVSDEEQVSNINQKLSNGTSTKKNGSATNAFNAGVSGSILLYNGGRVIATKHRLEELEKQSKIQLNSRIQNIMAEVMTGYYDIVRQQSYIKTIDRSIDVSQQQLTIIKVRQSVGLANNADLFQAQIDLNALVQSRQSQITIVEQAKTELLRLLTLKPDSTISIEDTIVVDRSIVLGDILNNLNKNADIQAAEEQIRINEFVVKETSALRYPSIRGIAGFNFVRSQAGAGQILLNQNYGPTIGVSIGIPIYNGSIYRRQKQVAEIDVKNADLNKRILERDYSAQVVKSYQSYVSSLQQLLAEQNNYDTTLKLLDVILKRFQQRFSTIVDVKNAQQSFEESGFRLVNLSYAAKSAEIELKRLANQLSL
jgi:outer membrane protein